METVAQIPYTTEKPAETVIPKQTSPETQTSATPASSDVVPTMTQGPLPMFGMLTGFIVAGVLHRRKE